MPRKVEMSPEEKVKLVRQCKAGELGICEAGRLAGVDEKTVRRWVAIYETEGAEGFLPQERNRVYSSKTKQQAVLDYISGKGSLQDVCKKHKIRNTRQLSNWIKVYNAHGNFSSVKHSGGGSYMKQGRETTQEERIQIRIHHSQKSAYYPR